MNGARTATDAEAVALDALEEAGVRVSPGYADGVTMFHLHAVQSFVAGIAASGGLVGGAHRGDLEERLVQDLTFTLDQLHALAQWEDAAATARRARRGVTAQVGVTAVQTTFRVTDHGDVEAFRPLADNLLDGDGTQPPPFSPCCKSPLVSFEWANGNGQNHRAHPGQAVCVGCGKGHTLHPEQYAHLVAADAAYDARDAAERRAATKGGIL